MMGDYTAAPTREPVKTNSAEPSRSVRDTVMMTFELNLKLNDVLRYTLSELTGASIEGPEKFTMSDLKTATDAVLGVVKANARLIEMLRDEVKRDY